MNNTTYHPFNSTLYHGRNEPFESDRACYWYELIQAYNSQKIGLVGFACDQGVRRNQGRVGAKYAPDAIRQAFGKLPCSSALLDKYGSDRDGKLTSLIGDCGNIECVDNDEIIPYTLEQTQQAYADKITEVLNQKGLAIGLGGGHAIAYGSFVGLWQSLSDSEKAKQRIGVINFDAHLDIRCADMATSGTPFLQIAKHLQASQQAFNYLCIGVSEYGNTAALFDRAKELNVQMIFDDDCYRKPFSEIAGQLTHFIKHVDIIYLTIDMDCFQAGLVPGVSATAAKGLMLDLVERCLEKLMASQKVKVVDLAEMNPIYDVDGLSSKVAARLCAKLCNQYLLYNI